MDVDRSSRLVETILGVLRLVHEKRSRLFRDFLET